jgi:hypothetical protein
VLGPPLGEEEVRMLIEGEVVGVMETWPLQLAVQTDAGTYHVILGDTVITSGGRSASPEDIRPGLDVRVEGEASGRRGMTASRIDIIEMQA